MTEKQVLFESQVDIVGTPPNWASATMLDHDYPSSVPSSVPSSAELGWPLVSLAKVSSTGYSRFGLQHSSTHRGASNYNYGYSTAELPGKLGLLLFSTDGEEDSGYFGCSSCAWVRDSQQRWIVGCWTCIALLSLCTLAVLAMILVFCIIIPRSPYLEAPDQAILVQSFNVTKNPPLVNSSSAQQGGAPSQTTVRFSAHFILQLVFKNPNRVPTNYCPSRFSVAYGDTVVVGEATVAAFSQKAHGSTQKVVDLMADANVSQQNAPSLLTDATDHDDISLQVHGRVQARLQVLGRSTPPVLIKLWCSVKIKVKELQVTDQECHSSKQKVLP